MATVHRATISPTKLEIATAWLDGRPDGGRGEVEQLGAFRYDDPDGEVGVETLLLARDGAVFVLPMTYRAAPLDGAEDHLLARMQHSVLGERWIHHLGADPVGTACFVRALRGEQEQAATEIVDDGVVVARREPTLEVVAEDGAGTPGDPGAAGLRLADRVDPAQPLDGVRRLVVRWEGGQAVVAALGG